MIIPEEKGGGGRDRNDGREEEKYQERGGKVKEQRNG